MPPRQPRSLPLRVSTLFAAIIGVIRVDAGLIWETHMIEQSAKPDTAESAAVFRFRNDGADSVVITAIDTGCECTVASASERTYAAGERGEIKVIYTHGQRVGLQENTIHVLTDENPRKPTALTMRVRIDPPFSCSTELLFWSTGRADLPRTVTVDSGSTNPIVSLEAAAQDPAALQASVTITSPGNYQITIVPLGNPAALSTHISATVKLADGTRRNFKIFAIVR